MTAPRTQWKSGPTLVGIMQRPTVVDMGLHARRSSTVKQLDRAHLGRTSDADDLQIVRADGSYLYDVHGKKYLDFVMGWCVGNLGWNPAEVRARVRDFIGPDYVVPSALYKPA